MKIVIADNYEHMSRVAAEMLLGYMHNSDRRVNLSITAGTTPIGMYEIMVPLVKNRSYFDNVHYYNFDEIPYKSGKQEGITITDLRKFYFTPAAIKEDRIHKLDGENYLTQDERIKKDGGLDLILLGIGADGHYCGNLPGTTQFSDYTTKVECVGQMKSRIGRLFSDPNEVPDYYVTMGPRTVMSARNMILFASGEAKADIIARVVYGTVDISIPASILAMHPNLTIVVDKAAGSKLKA